MTLPDSPPPAPSDPTSTVAEQTRLGMEAHARGDLDTCIDHFHRALELAPDMAEAHNNLGVALHAAARYAEASRCFQDALAIVPDDTVTLHHLGLAFQDEGRLEEAVACFRQAVELSPDFAAAHNDLGGALIRQGLAREGVASLERAIHIDPRCADAMANIGLACEDAGMFSEAFQATLRALQIAPGHAEAHTTLGMMLLRAGHYADGWREYEWRWQCRRFKRPAVHGPIWDGASLQGRTILLSAEQGIGDTVQFFRYGEILAAMGARVIGWCPQRLVPILSTCPGYTELVASDAPLPPFDVQASVMSVPGLVGTGLETIPARVPYLHADPERIEAWRRALAAGAGAERPFTIGVAWQGNRSVATYSSGRNRSYPPQALAPLAALPGVRFLSLQAGPDRGRAPLPAGLPDFDPGMALESDPDAAFVDTAAAIMTCDLVISCDTSIAHLAGALGAPVWTALPLVADWRWLVDRDDSPWYPSMRLFRQRHLGDWAGVFECMAARLKEQIDAG